MSFIKSIASTTLILALASPAFAGEISLSGTGVVRAAPDMATISTGVVSQAETAREALDANNAAMERLIAVLREAGLENRDIQTSDFNVSPQYVYSDRRDPRGYSLPPEISGYQVSNTVTIAVRDLEKLGTILDQAVSEGANAINGISFSVAESDKLLEQARRRAFADAHSKALVYADAAGVELGAIESISEHQDYMPPQPMLRTQAMDMEAAQSVPVEAGELSFSVNVSVTWEISE
ncbi:SIMPL domain-containing protein [Pelagibacterium limicola]|uniref:SIMPL domain-containing protein n=1 Tax=Pelagibacterium limicola TaxID=2791022 RepID=UPI0018AFDBE8|nr:SIMPL domain-containing protein [Pelagibacterium limicola]